MLPFQVYMSFFAFVVVYVFLLSFSVRLDFYVSVVWFFRVVCFPVIVDFVSCEFYKLTDVFLSFFISFFLLIIYWQKFSSYLSFPNFISSISLYFFLPVSSSCFSVVFQFDVVLFWIQIDFYWFIIPDLFVSYVLFL